MCDIHIFEDRVAKLFDTDYEAVESSIPVKDKYLHDGCECYIS